MNKPIAAPDRYDLLTHTDPGTPMGEFMRQYWIPAARSNELVADGAPMRLKLLGEKLIAFRDTSGRVAIMDHRCPHRVASLFYGRNEENGIRCVYHGWKYDVDGKCLDMANVPPERDFKDKVRAKAYLTAEQNGLVWVFMGERSRAPALPPFESAQLPEEGIEYRFVMRRSNWLQAMEGDMDTSHLGFLHFGGGQKKPEMDGYNADHRDNLLTHRAPEYKVAEMPYGLSYGAYRPAEGDATYWRVAHFLFPFWAMPPITSIDRNILTRAWVPLDDEHCMFISIAQKGYLDVNRVTPASASLTDVLHPNTSDWLGRFRMISAEENDYFIDRDVQKHESFTGIEGIHVQDQAVVESMGAIVDHSLETLAPSDVAVVRIRRLLLGAVQDFIESKQAPIADTPELYANVRGGYYTTSDTGDWQAVHRQKIADAPPTAN